MYDNEVNYFGFTLAPLLKGRVLFNYNHVFNGFEFIFSNSRQV